MNIFGKQYFVNGKKAASSPESSITLVGIRRLSENECCIRPRDDAEEITVDSGPVKEAETPQDVQSTGISDPDDVITTDDDENDGETANRRPAFWRPNANVDAEIVKYEKTEEEKKNIKKALLENEFLQNIFKDTKLDELIAAMEPRVIEADQLIVKQGDAGDEMFVSESGTFDVIINDKHETSFNGRRVFGELAIMYKNPRLATIRAVTDCKVWVLDGPLFQQISIQNAMAEEHDKVVFLKNVPPVNKASELKLKKIANIMKVQFFKANTEIVKEGDKGDNFYIIKAGNATVKKKAEGVVCVLIKGAVFGERALLGVEFRQATVIANAPGVECLYLSRDDFIENLGDIEDFMNKKDESIQRQSMNLPSEYGNVAPDDLEIIATIGEGSFGRVDLAYYKKQDIVFAMKKQKKANFQTPENREHLLNEKCIQYSCRCNFIVRLYNTYQDRKFVYFLMECCMGGDLFTLLNKIKFRGFDDKSAQFLSGCVLEALHYLHERDLVFRDLKPENVMLDVKGYAKLTDFGFAKHVLDGERTYTHAGTVEYVPPEIILDRGHDKAADCWSFGIFIYELLVGKTPFKSDDDLSTYNAIIKGIKSVSFPSKMNKHAISLVQQLCSFDPSHRIGCKLHGMNEIRKQRWYDNFDWERLRDRKIKSPFVPKLKGVKDLRYFPKFPSDNYVPPDVDIWEDF